MIKHSGVGVFDELLEKTSLSAVQKIPGRLLGRGCARHAGAGGRDPGNRFRELIPGYDSSTYGGGSPVVEHYRRLGAANCHPIYNALDPETHYPVPPDPGLPCDLLFVGHRLPDRERRVEEFFFRAAELAPDCRFALGGEGWGGKRLPRMSAGLAMLARAITIG